MPPRSRISRRDLFKLTAAGVLAAPSSDWLLPRVALAAEGGKARTKSCIMLHMQGGMSQHHTFTVPEIGAQNQQVATSVPGVAFCEFFPRLAARMNDICLFRGMNTGNSVHERARSMMHTGYNPNGTVPYPSVGNIAACELGVADAELPNFVNIYGGSDGLGSGPLHRSEPAYLGPQHAPVNIGDAARGMENLRTFVDRSSFDEGASLLNEFESTLQSRRPSSAAAAQQANVRKALQLIHSDRMRAFDIEREPLKIRDSYGPSQFGKSLLLARRLVEAGVPFVEITLDGWDDHNGPLGFVRKRSEYLDPSISFLIDDLKIRGMFDDTLIVLMSEFGRTPKLAENQALGGGHYANAWTTFMAGGGVKGGTVIGKVDAKGAEVTDRPVNCPDFLATMCHALKIDFQKEYMSREGRPMTFLTKSAKPVAEAF